MWLEIWAVSLALALGLMVSAQLIEHKDDGAARGK
jgi:hypothetical protein